MDVGNLRGAVWVNFNEYNDPRAVWTGETIFSTDLGIQDNINYYQWLNDKINLLGKYAIVRIDYREGLAVPGNSAYWNAWKDEINTILTNYLTSSWIKVIQIGNEPNIEGAIPASDYAYAFNFYYSQRYTGRPLEFIVAGPGDPSNPASQQWFADMVASLNVTDGWGLHTYGPDPQNPNDSFWRWHDYVEILRAKFYGTRPVYITEFNTGCSPFSCPLPVGGWSSFFNDAYAEFRAYNDWTNAIRGEYPPVHAALYFPDAKDQWRNSGTDGQWYACSLQSDSDKRNAWLSADATTGLSSGPVISKFYRYGLANPDVNSNDPNAPIMGSYLGEFDWNGTSRDLNQYGDTFIVVGMMRWNAPYSGNFEFRTWSDDGSWLWVDMNLVVNNGGLHAPREAVGSLWVDGGPHFIVFKMYENYGGAVGGFQWRPAGQGKWQWFEDLGGRVMAVYHLDLASDLNSPDPNVIRTAGFIGNAEPNYGGHYVDFGSDDSPTSGGPTGTKNVDFVMIQGAVINFGSANVKTQTDDGSWLWIDGQIVVNNAGLHGEQAVVAWVDRPSGPHVILYKMFEHTGRALTHYGYESGQLFTFIR